MNACLVRLVTFSLFVFGMSISNGVRSIEFSSAFLNNQGGEVELEYFENGSSIAPGYYDIDIYLNHKLMNRQRIHFFVSGKDKEVSPHISVRFLDEIGVNIARFQREGLIAQDINDSAFVDVRSLALGADIEFEVNSMSLQISMPQAYIKRRARGYINPTMWDEGIIAFYSNYQTNFNNNVVDGQSHNYRYVGFRNGFNIGGWRLRNDSSVTGSTGGRDKFTSNRSYVERDIVSLKSKFAAGELYTQGEIFDSVRYQGAELASELGMLTDDEVGYAPVVRGISETNAIVEISQNNYVIYSTSVPAGSFEISDIYPSGSNGDLTIKIIEADGREREYTQAYSYLPVMARRGNARYNLVAGKYEPGAPGSAQFTQGTLVYGLTENLTSYGGLILNESYSAFNLGMGVNSSLGGFSFDVTNSNSSDKSTGQKNIGQSARFLYSKTLVQTETTFTMVGYRYSTGAYRTFSQHVDDNAKFMDRYIGRQKSQFDINVNQPVAGRGSLFLSLGETNYWARQRSTRRWQFGYSGGLQDISYSFALSRTEGQSSQQRADTQIAVSVSLPFGGNRNSHRMHSNVTASSQGDSVFQTGLTGNVPNHKSLNYSVQGSHSENSGRAVNVGMNWDAPVANVNVNYGQGRDNKHFDIGASGSVVLHQGGLTLGKPVAETFALIEVPNTPGIGVDSSNNLRTDGNGYAVLPYAQPYRYNWINLETSTLGSNIEIEEMSRQVVPTRGAVVKAKFSAETGRRIQFKLNLSNAGKIPFGAQVYGLEGRLLGSVDNLSRVLVFGVSDVGSFSVRWAGGDCNVNYILPNPTQNLIYERYEAACSFQ